MIRGLNNHVNYTKSKPGQIQASSRMNLGEGCQLLGTHSALSMNVEVR